MLANLKVGILGGGRLGVMLVSLAPDHRLNISIMEKRAATPLAGSSSSFVEGDPTSYDDVMAFGKGLDIITVEKEAVCTKALRALERKGVKVFPRPETIELIRNKYIQKKFLQNSGIPVVPGVPVLNRADLYGYLNKLPACLKKCRWGDDGDNVMEIHNETDIQTAFDEPCVLEELVEVEQEFSVMVARNASGVIECYDPALVIFDKVRFVLDFQLCPQNISHQLAIEATTLAIRIAEALNLIGLMSIEMFVTKDGRLLVNELALRPYNSGRYIKEACGTSEYERQFRAILGLSPKANDIERDAILINILEPGAAKKSSEENAIRTILGMSNISLQSYGTQDAKGGRKVWALAIAEHTMENTMSKAVMIRHMLRPIDETK
jgi:5-(carboxyamino)imidazole ribonucleotide synthase